VPAKIYYDAFIGDILFGDRAVPAVPLRVRVSLAGCKDYPAGQGAVQEYAGGEWSNEQ